MAGCFQGGSWEGLGGPGPPLRANFRTSGRAKEEGSAAPNFSPHPTGKKKWSVWRSQGRLPEFQTCPRRGRILQKLEFQAPPETSGLPKLLGASSLSASSGVFRGFHRRTCRNLQGSSNLQCLTLQPSTTLQPPGASSPLRAFSVQMKGVVLLTKMDLTEFRS